MAEVEFSSFFTRGLRSAQPAANTVRPGTHYFVTDESKEEISDGASWLTLGGGVSGVSLIDKVVTAVTITNSALQTSLYSKSVPAQISTGIIRFTLDGTWFNNTGSNQTVVFKIKLGATTMWQDTSLAIGTNAGTFPFRMVGEIANLNATNSQRLTANVNIGAFGAPTTGQGGISISNSSLTSHVIVPIAGVAAEDWTSAKTLDITAQLSAANANFTVTRQFAMIEGF
jgi:hypothetical protein